MSNKKGIELMPIMKCKNKTVEASIEKYLVEAVCNLGGVAWKFTAPKVKGFLTE